MPSAYYLKLLLATSSLADLLWTGQHELLEESPLGFLETPVYSFISP